MSTEIITSAEAKHEIDKIVSENKFVLFTATWCPDCVYVKKILEEHNILEKFYVWELSRYEKGTSNFKTYTSAWFAKAEGQQNIPLLFIDGLYFGTEHQIKSWEAAGKLQEQFEKLGLF
ncbi:hypothetical protein QEN19_003195 [Hanseniaspora menglaensis]